MYINCVDEIIKDMAAGNSVSKDKLITYVTANGFNYIACYGGGNIFGNTDYENALSNFIEEAHNNCIQVGIVGASASFFQDNFQKQRTPDYDFQPLLTYLILSKVPDSIIVKVNKLIPIANPVPPLNPVIVALSELTKLSLRSSYNYNKNYRGKIDVLSLEDEFWNNSENDVDQQKYSDHIFILNAMYTAKAANVNIWPVLVEDYLKRFRGDGTSPTATQQTRANGIDALTDRILLTSYNSYIVNLFFLQCEQLEYIGASSSKPQTEIWPLFSAEWDDLNWVHTCPGPNQGLLWDHFLGGFLTDPNQTQTSSGKAGTLHEAEDQYKSDELYALANFNANASCPNYNTDHGDNVFGGYMWFSYDNLVNNPVSEIHQRKGRMENPITATKEVNIFPNPAANNLSINIGSYTSANFELYAIDGKPVITQHTVNTITTFDLSALGNGIYLITLNFPDGEMLHQKLIINH